MRNMYKSLLLFLTLMIPLLGRELCSFEEIYNHLKEGGDIRLVIDFDDCPMQSGKSNLSVYTEAHSVMLRPAFLQFANTPLTTNHPAFPKVPVLENVTYRITNKGEVTITMRLITLPDYQVKLEHVTEKYLGDSVRVYTSNSL
jgi:hypothetical protein